LRIAADTFDRTRTAFHHTADLAAANIVLPPL